MEEEDKEDGEEEEDEEDEEDAEDERRVLPVCSGIPYVHIVHGVGWRNAWGKMRRNWQNAAQLTPTLDCMSLAQDRLSVSFCLIEDVRRNCRDCMTDLTYFQDPIIMFTLTLFASWHSRKTIIQQSLGVARTMGKKKPKPHRVRYT